MRMFLTLPVLLILSLSTFVQSPNDLSKYPPLPPVRRHVQSQTIVSKELPAADLTFSPHFHYVDSQVANLYGNAIAEQHLFVKSAGAGPVQAFYWVQFEHFLPSNKYTYDYKLPGTTDIGGVPFVYDIKAFLDYQSDDLSDPRSDSAAMATLMARHHIAFPKNAARVRMFHLPTKDLRSELMIIYGEVLPPKVSATTDGIELNTASSEFAKALFGRAMQNLTIRKH